MKSPKELRKKYPKFTYKKYYYSLKGNNLRIFFDFRISSDIRFKPSLIIKNITRSQFRKIEKRALDNLIFHVGLMEIPSYWKATCSPEIIVKAGPLNQGQIKWWKDLILKGMGQFFYENKINWRSRNFLRIRNDIKKEDFAQQNLSFPRVGKQRTKRALETEGFLKEGGQRELCDRYLVPMGGGKDSIVTLEKLKVQKKHINVFAANPTNAVKDVLRVAGIKNPIIVERKIDPKLLELNKKGYLNGHTPFTAILSFLAVFCAVLFDYKNIAFSNEKSANEGNVKYLGKVINHQWSKSSEFEKKFKYYCKKYLAKNVHYFSFLRKYTELEIARMFAKYPKYFSVFSSCNRVVAKKLKKRWCGNCPKCLFSYLILCPYLEEKKLLKIFGKNLLKKKSLFPIIKSLIGQGGAKPFECVGTYAEAKKALNLCLKNSKTKK